MNYFTKEWHKLCGQCAYQYDLDPSPSAKRKSEAYFQSLYAQKLEENLKAAEALAQMSPEELAGSAEEAVLRDYQAKPFDREAGTAQFKAEWEDTMAELSAVLPQSILDQVADLRVLALGVSTKEVKRDIARFCKQNEAKVEKANQDYADFLDRKAFRYPDELMEHYGFSECTVTGLEWKGTDLVLYLDHSLSDTQVNTVIWHQAEILEQEPGLVGSTWVREELYPAEGGFAFHTLLETGEGKPIYFTLQAAGVDYVFDAPEEGETAPEQE